MLLVVHRLLLHLLLDVGSPGLDAPRGPRARGLELEGPGGGGGGGGGRAHAEAGGGAAGAALGGFVVQTLNKKY